MTWFSQLYANNDEIEGGGRRTDLISQVISMATITGKQNVRAQKVMLDSYFHQPLPLAILEKANGHCRPTSVDLQYVFLITTPRSSRIPQNLGIMYLQ